jgi:peptidoglycan/LPS O-acetylase OafA/YrhL
MSASLMRDKSGILRVSLPASLWSARNGRVPSLDGIRAVSVLIMLIGHMVLPARFVGISALGLDCFFLVSGFLITRLFFAEAKETGSVSLGDFYKRRLLRLYPVIVVYMVLVIDIQLLRHNHVNANDVGSVFFYYLNYLEAFNEPLNIDTTIPIGVLWSLSIEEQFYLFMPLIFIFCRAKPKTVLWAGLAICVTSLLIRYLYVTLWPGIENSLFIYRHSETRFDAIAYGVVLAALCEMPIGRRLIGIVTSRTGFLISLIVLLASYAIRDPYFQNTIRFTIQSLALMVIVSGVVFAEPFRFINTALNHSVSRWIGNLSYSLYVWHGGCMFLFGWWIASKPVPEMISLHVALTFALANCSYYLIERPAMNWGKKILMSPPARGTSVLPRLPSARS